MPVFESPPLETLAPAKDRWTPIYLEHGRIEVDDASVKWVGADRTVLRLPIATLSAIMLGPGTTVTHAAIKACSQCNTPVCWIGADGLHFYAFGAAPTHDNARARHQADLYADKHRRVAVARRMFSMRFREQEVMPMPIKSLMAMEGKRIKALYAELGAKYGVTWKGRQYDQSNWDLADGINRAISAANAALYALTTAIVCSMGYIPQLGFVHSAGTMPFVFDMADIYKPQTTLEAAFQSLAIDPEAGEEAVITRLKMLLEEHRIVQRLPVDLDKLLDFTEGRF